MARREKLPSLVTGYELGKDTYGYFSVIVPEGKTVNYVKNPTFFTNDPEAAYKATGNGAQPCDLYYSYVNASGAPKDRPLSIHGAGAKITPTIVKSAAASIYYTADNLPAGTYTFSAYYSGEASNEFLLQVQNVALTVQYGETASSYGSGLNGFQRLHVTFTIPSAMNVALKLTELADSQGNLSPFYTDMWQLENKPYVTHHFIGHPHHFANLNGEFSWWGTQYYSESVRTERSYESGREVDLSSVGFKLTGIVGLGVNPLNTVISEVASGGGVHDNTTNAVRTFTLVGTIYGRDMQDLLTQRRNLYELLRPKGRNTADQPTTLLFRIYDCERKNTVGQPIYIFCRYVSGLEGAMDSESGENISITFSCEDPYLYSAYLKNYDITPNKVHQQLTGDTNKISAIFMSKSEDGEWSQLDLRLAGPTEGDLCVVKDIVPDGAGGYYILGTYATAVHKGVSTTVNKIFRYNPTTGTITALGSGGTKGAAGGRINGITPLPSGAAILYGTFTSCGGVANTKCIAKYTPGTNSFSSIASTVNAFSGYSAEVKDVEYGDDDNIYVSGIFGQIGNGSGTVTGDGLARMNVTTQIWTVPPIERANYVYPPNGINFVRLYRQRTVEGYLAQPTTGFISGDFQTLAVPATDGTVYWDGSETFYTNFRANGNYGGGEHPPSFNPMLSGVIDHSSGSAYFVNPDNNVYKMDFVMPAYQKILSTPPTVPLHFTTVYLYPDRNSPTIWKRLSAPFVRTVVANIGGDYQQVPLSTLSKSKLKLIDGRLVISPNYSYGLDGYEVPPNIIPLNKTVPLVWYHNTWGGAAGQGAGLFNSYGLSSSNYAYTAAFHVNFATDEALIAVNPGHISPTVAGDNHINAITSGEKAVQNNGENVHVYYRLVGPLSLKSFINNTTNQRIDMDGYKVQRYETVHLVTNPRTDMGQHLNAHMLDSSDVNLRLVPGKNMMSCKADDTIASSKVSLIFRERYASISKAIEYVGG